MRTVIAFAFLVLNISAAAQVGQLDIPRVQQMPNLPSPYLMRDWKAVTIDYDQLVFTSTATGQYLPLLQLKPAGINYPEISTILLQTYVGTNTNNQAEAINIIPALVGASLMNIDKSNQNGINWALKAKDFFNRANGQNVVLNGYSSQSGGDWWYNVMPNIFFYQLYTQYPDQKDFHEQLETIADRWLEAVHAMGGKTAPWTKPQMNYRAWDLITMTGNADGVKEPEAAGGIGWLLYHAYLATGKTKYLEGAQMCLEFLSDLNSNPAYELQLPYGALIAAKMNAELGTQYDVPKIINWTFDRNPLRDWGVIAGTWNGSDVDGLIGEARDSGNDYAFAMNGFQQAAALVPLIKYDKRFARGIAKWVLNLANASRLFYPQYLPETSQDDYAWSSTFDSKSVIAYEALKEKNNFNNNLPLYGTGDAKRNNWAETNLSLYSSSNVGYLAAVVETTDVEGILILDLNKTDFFAKNTFPTHVVYNPHASDKQVTIQLPSGSFDIYDALSETFLATSVNGAAILTVKADEAVLPVYIPAGAERHEVDGKLYAGTEVVDYHYGYGFTGSLRIKSLAAADTLVEFDQMVPVYAAVENYSAATQFSWYDNAGLIKTSTSPAFTWTVPKMQGENVLRLHVDDNGKVADDSISFNVVSRISVPPVINEITTDKLWYTPGSQAIVTCDASDKENTSAELNYEWSVSGGALVTQNGASATWQVPASEGIVEITCKVTNLDAMSATSMKSILVKHLSSGETTAFAYFPFDGNSKDFSGNHRDATMVGVDPTTDARGEEGKAFFFNSGSDIISLANSDELNFQDQITLSFWVNLESLSEESFILSHGSWEERWKISVTPDLYLRWTVKTNTATKDLDSSFPLLFNHFYHFTAVYSGYSMELYADGELDTFLAHSGQVSTTNKSLTFGRKDSGTTRYSLHGTLDEVRIYNAALLPDEISTLKSLWNPTITSLEQKETGIIIYPNPAHSKFYIDNANTNSLVQVRMFDPNGRAVAFTAQWSGAQIVIDIEDRHTGILILELKKQSGQVLHKKIIIK
jgi:hypothetical protein